MSIKIITYHFIKKENDNLLKKINGVTINHFKKQISYLKKNYKIISMEDLISNYNKKFIEDGKKVILTFDDGYRCHYDYVFPILKKNKIKGCFYPTVRGTLTKKLINVNQIQYLVKYSTDTKRLFLEIKNYINKYNLVKNLDLKIKKFMNNKQQKFSRNYDSKFDAICKFVLQNLIPEKNKDKVVNFFFNKNRPKNLTNYKMKNFYLKKKHIMEMIDNGMHFGIHGNWHFNWKHLNNNKIKKEINISTNFLIKLGINKNNLTCCYPWGGFNNSTFFLLNKKNFKIGLTTLHGKINYKNFNNRLILPRIDINEISKEMKSS